MPEFEDSLSYIGSSKTARTIEKPNFKINNKKITCFFPPLQSAVSSIV